MKSQTYALIKNSAVANIIIADDAFAQHIANDWEAVVPVTDAGIGWQYTNGEFVAPELPEPAPQVPQVVSRAQGKTALIQAQLWSRVLDYVANLPEPEKSLSEVVLHDTQEWRRDNAFLVTAGAALGLDDQQMDALFVAAAEIEL